MLKWRIITAAILIPIVLLLIYFAPYWVYALGVWIVALAGAFEWAKLSQIQKHWQQHAFMISILLVSFMSFYLPLLILFLSLIWWILASISLIRFPQYQSLWQRSMVLRIGAGFFTLVPFTVALLWIKQLDQGANWLVLLLLMVWSADIGAYFAGRKWGKTKLMPLVSPNKSLEGVYGGFGLFILVTLLYGFFCNLPIVYHPIFIMIAIITFMFSIVGDLSESAIKRYAAVKDSGNWLPGHGGILDRIDSLTAAAPLFSLGLWIVLSK